MNKYILEGSFQQTSLSRKDTADKAYISIPLFVNGKLRYGLAHLSERANELGIYPTEMGYDIITLAALVYLADTRISRERNSQDSWTREIELVVPVANPYLWNKMVSVVQRMLRFLTGDLWAVRFIKRDVQLDSRGERKNKQYDIISLFSGGMDSLIGSIDYLEMKKNILLVSHAGDSLTKKAQNDLLGNLKKDYPNQNVDQVALWMQFPHNYLCAGDETSTRSRSFLFISLAVFLITGTTNLRELFIPENGVIALNVPLDPLRLGAHSTRTTHPFYLKLWNDLLNGLETGESVRNIFWNKTKGEMADECLNKDELYKLISSSISCSSPQKARWKGYAPQHCGYCVPCIIRRAAMFKAFGKDPTQYLVSNLADVLSDEEKEQSVQLKSFIYAIGNLRATPGIEKHSILRPGPLPVSANQRLELASVYKRGLLEVGKFLDANMKGK